MTQADWWTKDLTHLTQTLERLQAKEAAIDALLVGGGALIHQAAITLTDADIKALPTLPLVVQAAPPAGYVHWDVLSVLYFTKVGNGYGNQAGSQDGGITQPYLGNNLHGPRSNIVNGFLASAAPAGLIMAPAPMTLAADAVDVTSGAYLEGEALPTFHQLRTEAATVGFWNMTNDYEEDVGNFTGGDPANTMTVTLLYRLLNLSTGRFE